MVPSYLVVDSSVLIFYDRKGKLDAFLQQKKKENYRITIPKAIAQEVIDEPERFAESIKKTAPELSNKMLESAKRIRAAVDQGLIELKEVNYTKFSKVMDNVRKRLSKLEAKPENAVKKGDSEATYQANELTFQHVQ